MGNDDDYRDDDHRDYTLNAPPVGARGDVAACPGEGASAVVLSISSDFVPQLSRLWRFMSDNRGKHLVSPFFKEQVRSGIAQQYRPSHNWSGERRSHRHVYLFCD